MAGGDPAGPDDGEITAFAVLRERAAVISAMPEGPAKREAVRRFAVEAAELYQAATAMRKAQILRVMEEQEFTLEPLAHEWGISKARMGQINKERKKGTRDG